MTAAGLSWPFVGRRGELERILDALADRRVKAVLIAGRSGVGKSRLAEEALVVARGAGAPVAHATATSTGATVPLAVLSPILPPRVDLGDTFALFAAVRDHVAGLAPGGRLVLAIDDVDLLDNTSAALVAFLLAADVLFVIATIGAAAATPEVFDALWRGGRALRIDLGTFDRGGVDVLLHVALRAPVTAPAAQALWDASQGNVLYLRELVTVARDEGVLRCDEGAWSLRSRLAATAGVSALIERRVRDLSAGERTVLDLLAVCGPLGLDDVAAHASPAVLSRLERLELIVVHRDGRRQELALTHPLHARVLRAALPTLAARELLLAQIDRIRGYGARRRGDPLRLATWLLDATGTAEPQLLAHATALAHDARDAERTRRLAEAALRHGPHARVSVAYAEALAQDGDAPGAEEVLAVAARAADPAELTLVTMSRAANLYFGLGRLAAARACLHEHGRPAGPAGYAAMEAYLLACAGQPRSALELLGDVEPTGDAPAVPVLWLLARARALAEYGDPVRAELAARRGYAAHLGVSDRAGLPHPAVHLENLALALLQQGRFDEAAATCREGLHLAPAAGPLAALLTCVYGRVEYARGRPGTAATHARAAWAQARRPDRAPDDPQPPAVLDALGVLLLARAALGGQPDAELLTAARAALGEVARDAPPPVDSTPGQIRIHAALAWATAQAGDAGAARRALLHAARCCREQGRHAHEMELLHDAIRVGDTGAAAEVAGRLAELATALATPLATARAAHARAVRRRHPAELVAAAGTFAALGADLVAAEVFAHAARLWRAGGDGRAAARAAARSASLARGCEDATTPGLRAPDAASPLSPRESEIALLAARGIPSRDIAAALFLSVRTVNNHLQSAYGKLGISTRAELAIVLDAAPAPASAPGAGSGAASAPGTAWGAAESGEGAGGRDA